MLSITNTKPLKDADMESYKNSRLKDKSHKPSSTDVSVRHSLFWHQSYEADFNIGKDRGFVEQILIPMAGAGSRFAKISAHPKPFIPVLGCPMFMRAIQSLPQASRTVLITQPGLKERAENETKSLAGSVSILPQTIPLSGQASSCMIAKSALKSNSELLVSACDHAIATQLETWNYLRNHSTCNAAIMTIKKFPGAESKPESYAYVVPERLEKGEAYAKVQAVSVKRAISNNPLKDNVLVGTFWFREASTMIDGIKLLKKKGMQVNGEYYLDSIFNLLIEIGLDVRMVPLDGYICWGDPDIYFESLKWYHAFTKKNGLELQRTYPRKADQRS